MAGRKIIITAILMLIASLCIQAKEPPADLGYDPPEGWEFVMKLDSVSGMYLHCHNDTCITSVAFSGSREIPFFHRISYDGGDTWIDIDEIYPRIFIINSNTLHRLMREDKKNYYERSRDFYKTSEKYYINELLSSGDTIYHSPLDPDLIIATYKDGVTTPWYTNETMMLYISKDGGKNWEEMKNLPKQVQGLTVYRIAFDWAEKGHWFLNAIDGVDVYHEVGPNFGTKHYETFDDGKTFREIKFDPIGISGFTTIYLGLDGTKYYREISIYYESRGITLKKYNDTIISSEYIDWLYKMDPTKPKSNSDSGYVNAIHGTFKFDFNNYQNQFTPLYEITDRLNVNKEAINTYLYHSTNYGNNWILLNEFYKKPRYINSSLDQGTKTVWIHVKDEEFKRGNNNAYYKGSLWKLKLPWKSTSVKDISDNKSEIVIYPNPANNLINIRFNLTIPGFTKISIYDNAGREVKRVYEGHLEAGEQNINSDILGLKAGSYFIKVSSVNTDISLKLIINR